MATITLHREEFEQALLPPSCMRCGAPATLARYKTFSWGPDWLLALLLIGALCFGPLFWVAIILNVILLERMRVPIPLCEKHRNHWRPLQVVLYGGIGLVALSSFATIVLCVTARGPHDSQGLLSIEFGIMFGVGTLLLLVAMVFLAAILQVRVIRATHITSQSITLTGVAEEFAREAAKIVNRCAHCGTGAPALSERGFCPHCQQDVDEAPPAPPTKRGWWRFSG